MKIKLLPGRPSGKRAQVSLELALSLICVFLLVMACLKVFFWVNERMVLRQEGYEATRGNSVVKVDESEYNKLNIFDASLAR